MSCNLPLRARRPFHEIVTPRLILRSARPCDAAPFVVMINDPLNRTYGSAENSAEQTLQQQLDFIKQCENTTAEGKNAWMTIVLRRECDIKSSSSVAAFDVDDGVVIGTTGFNHFKTEVVSISDQQETGITGNIGLALDHRYRRHGYATEAICAVIEYGFHDLGCAQISMNTDQTNLPWRTLMKRFGLDSVEVLQTIPHPSYPENEQRNISEAFYCFDKAVWKQSVDRLIASGRWYLSSEKTRELTSGNDQRALQT